jgi:hypothetical protein
MPAYVPAPPFPFANRLRPSDGAAVLPWCQTSSMDNGGGLVGGGAASSGPIYSAPLPYRSEVRLTARCQLWHSTGVVFVDMSHVPDVMAPSQPALPTYLYVLLSNDGVTWATVWSEPFSVWADSAVAVDLGHFRDRSYGYNGPPPPPLPPIAGSPAPPGGPGPPPGLAGQGAAPTVLHPPWIMYRVLIIPDASGDAVLVEAVESP